MGRFLGRRPDPTATIGRAISGELLPGEHVIAGVHLQIPGTTSAALAAGVSGAVGATVDLPPSFDDVDDERLRRWYATAVQIGIDPDAVGRLTWSALALTNIRVLVLRRSRLTRRVVGLVAAWPLADVDRLDVPSRGSSLVLHRGGAALVFELPQAHRFLPAVYRELPARFANLRSERTAGRTVDEPAHDDSPT